MLNRERCFVDSEGRELLLKSKLTVDLKAEQWIVDLALYRKGKLGKKLIDRRTMRKSGEWQQNVIKLLVVQEELQILTSAGVEVTILDLLT